MKFKKTLAMLLCVAMLVCCFSMTAFAAGTASVIVEASKSDVVPGDEITFTVSLVNANNIEGGVWNYEYYLSIPDGLTIVSGECVDKTFASATFNSSALKGTAFGMTGAGYTGGKLTLATFVCKVDEDANGSMTVSTTGVSFADKDGNNPSGGTGSATVKYTAPHVCTIVAVDEVAAGDCKHPGVKAHYKCSDSACGKLYADSNGTVEVTLEELALAGKHDYQPVTGKPASCTDTGLTEGSACRVCGDVSKPQEEIPPLGHKVENWAVDTEATCTTAGSKSGECETCHELVTEVIPATGHKINGWKTDANNHWHECEVCGVVDKAAHTMKTVDGSKDKQCTVCGYQVKAPADSTLDNQPKTGDVFAEIAMFAAAAALVVGAVVVAKRKARN